MVNKGNGLTLRPINGLRLIVQSASRHGRFTLRGGATGTYRWGSWLHSTVGLNAMTIREFSEMDWNALRRSQSPSHGLAKTHQNNEPSQSLKISTRKHNCLLMLLSDIFTHTRDKCVSVIVGWRVRRLRMVERPPIRRIAANILNKQSRAADRWWSSSLGVARSANNSSP